MVRCEALQHQITEGNAAAVTEATSAAAARRFLDGGKGPSRASAAREVQLAQQELVTLSSLLVALLGGVPGQLADLFVVDTLSFLAAQLQWLDKQG